MKDLHAFDGPVRRFRRSIRRSGGKALTVFLALCALATGVGAPRPAHAQPEAHHAPLFYTPSFEAITRDAVRPLVAYIDEDGTALDWMYDSLIIFSLTLHQRNDDPVTVSDIVEFESALFGNGVSDGQLAVLADTVAGLRTELGDPSRRLRVYLAAPYVEGDQDANQYIQSLIDQWNAAVLPELELVGFYWGYAEGLSTSGDATAITRSVSHAHSQGYEMLWLPQNHDSWLEGWLSGCSSCGFDDISLQVGYAYTDSGTSRFGCTDDIVLRWGLSGTVIEIAPGISNPEVPGPDTEYENAMTYLRAMDHYNWGSSPLTVYYHGSVVSDYATGGATRRPIYDGLYRAATLGSALSAAPVLRLEAAADTFVEELSGHRDNTHGSDTYINLGTNSSGNALRAYLRFDVPSDLAQSRILAAHVQLYTDYYPYGSSIDDIVVYQVNDPSWSESSLSANTQPAAGSLTELAVHRFAEAGRSNHSIDVTEELSDARDAGKTSLSIMLRRRTEDNAPAEVQLYSRESTAGGGDFGPTLRVIHLPSSDPGGDDAGTMPPDAGPWDDAGGGADDGGAGGDDRTAVDDRSCGCRTAGARGDAPLAALLLLGIVALVLRRREAGYR